MNASLLRSPSENNMIFLAHPERCACITGNRPAKLLAKKEDQTISDEVLLESIRTLLMMLLADAVKHDRKRYFLLGMAKGIDLWAGECLLFLKMQLHKPVEIIAAYPNPSSAIPPVRDVATASLLQEITWAASAVICCRQSNAPHTFLARNDYMLEHSSLLLGAFRELHGGTGYTIGKSKSHKLPARLLDFRNLEPLLTLLRRFPELGEEKTVRNRYEFWQKHPKLLHQSGLLLCDGDY